MKRLIIGIAVLSLALGCSILKKKHEEPAPQPQPQPEAAERIGAQITSDIRATSTAFGIYEVEPDGSLKFVETDTVPLKPGQRYGWVVHLDTTRKQVKVREVFKMPRKPAEWVNVEDSTISEDQTTFDTTETRDVIDGKIGGRWKVVEGDPSGEHEIQIYIEDVLVATFSFKVE